MNNPNRYLKRKGTQKQQSNLKEKRKLLETLSKCYFDERYKKGKK